MKLKEKLKTIIPFKSMCKKPNPDLRNHLINILYLFILKLDILFVLQVEH